MATAVAHFVAFEVRRIHSPSWLRSFTTCRHGALVAVVRVKTVIHVADEIAPAMKPRASANEDAATKPFRPIVSSRGAGIRSDIIVTIGTLRSDSDFDADLSLRLGKEADRSNAG